MRFQRDFARAFAQNAIRKEIPKAVSRLDKQRSDERIRDESLAKAQSDFNQISSNALSALACLQKGRPGVFDVAALAAAEAPKPTSSVAALCRTSSKVSKPAVTIPANGALAFLLKDDPEVKEAFRIKVSDSNPGPARGRSASRAGRRPPSTSSAQRRSRSASQGSRHSQQDKNKGRPRSRTPSARSNSTSVRSFHSRTSRSPSVKSVAFSDTYRPPNRQAPASRSSSRRRAVPKQATASKRKPRAHNSNRKRGKSQGR